MTEIAGSGAILDGEWIERDDLAKELKISSRTLSRWTFGADPIPHVTVGCRTLYRRESVRAWLIARETKPVRRRRRAA